MDRFLSIRKFWSLNTDKKISDNFNDFSENIIKEIPKNMIIMRVS